MMQFGRSRVGRERGGEARDKRKAGEREENGILCLQLKEGQKQVKEKLCCYLKEDQERRRTCSWTFRVDMGTEKKKQQSFLLIED